MENFYTEEKNAVQEYLNKLDAADNKYNTVIGNYKTLLECNGIDLKNEADLELRRYDSKTKRIEAEARTKESDARLIEANNRTIEAKAKMIEAEARSKEAEARLIEAQNRSVEADAKVMEAQNRKEEAKSKIISTVIETTGRTLANVVGHVMYFGGLLLIANYEKDGSFPQKLVSRVDKLVIRN